MKHRLFLLVLILCTFVMGNAQEIRFVSNNAATETRTDEEGNETTYTRVKGSDSNDGKSFLHPFLTIEKAISDLGSDGGEVWVAEGTYIPYGYIGDNKSDQYRSFVIPANVTIRGGFFGYENPEFQTEEDNYGRVTVETKSLGNMYTHETILSGDLVNQGTTYTWNDDLQKYTITKASGNSYHVVWFATNGFGEDGRANGLEGASAMLEGCTIKDGFADETSADGHPHSAYGGGIYMVDGAIVENCRVYNCSAIRDGGGIYMDGGGDLSHTAVYTCQALGIGTSHGYGGGVCIDGNYGNNGIDESAGVGMNHCYVSGCAGRLGGGVALRALSTEGNGKYKVYASGSTIVNNTAATEGGGVYTENGGVISHATIARNRCNGSGATSNGVATGRSAGLYCRDNATVVNTVLWGGQCDANHDVQYASTRSTSSIKVEMQYVGLSQANYVDWSGTTKTGIIKLAKYNTSAEASAHGTQAASGEGYPAFSSILPTAGQYIYDVANNINVGEYCLDNASTVDWKTGTTSCINKKGFQSQDLTLAGGDEVMGVDDESDILGQTFPARCTLGSCSFSVANIEPQRVGAVLNFYVDPKTTTELADASVGYSWTRPAMYLNDVFDYISNLEYGDIVGKTINVYVKSGTIDNTSSSAEGRVRLCPLKLPSVGDLNIFGGYDQSLTGTDLSKRNPVSTPTVITGKIDNDYDNNVAHLFIIEGISNVLVDGFQIRYANAYSVNLLNPDEDEIDQNGAGLVISNATNVRIKDCLIAHCKAVKGAAVYMSNGSSATFENCIFHNNTAVTGGQVKEENGIIYIEDGCTASFDHCDVLRNVGYAFYNAGTVNMDNSVVYANMSSPLNDTNNNETLALDALMGEGTYSSVHKKNFFDIKASNYVADLGANTLTFVYNENSNSYPNFVNSTRNSGVSEEGDLTYYGRSTSFEPKNNSPLVNEASASVFHRSWGTDMTTVVTRDYGGAPDVGAIENHLDTSGEENSYADGQAAYGEVIYVRDYRKAGSTEIDYEAGGDGSSWAQAINGNANYYSYASSMHGSAEKATAPDGSSVNNSGTSVDFTYADGVLLHNDRVYLNYNGSIFQTSASVDDGTKFYFTKSGKYYPDPNNTNYSVNTYTIQAEVDGELQYVGVNLLTNQLGNVASEWLVNEGADQGADIRLCLKYTTSACDACQGSGKMTCPTCSGYGVVSVSGVESTCSACKGTGMVNCTTCGGTGSSTPRTYTKYIGKSEELTTGSQQWQCWSRPENSKEVYGINGLQYAVNMQSLSSAGGSRLQAPVASTSVDAKENQYYIGMLEGNTLGNDVYFNKYTKYNQYGANTEFTENGSYDGYVGTTDRSEADKFILISTGKLNKYYIYDVTKGKYVYYGGTGTQDGNVHLCSESDTDNYPSKCVWYVFSTNKSEGYHTYAIIPTALAADLSQPGWAGTTNTKTTWTKVATGEYRKNIYGNYDAVYRDGNVTTTTVYGNPLGLGTDESCNRWQFWSVPKTTSSGENVIDNKEVWVAAGTYTKDPEIRKGTFDLDVEGQHDESCFIIRDGVDVYGAFPATGNPGKNQRHPLVSRYIYDNNSGKYSYSKYETILKPITTTLAKGGVRRVLAPAYSYNVWNDTKDNGFLGATWDGFTIREGNVDAGSITEARVNGAAGVAVYQHTTIKNCVINDNIQFAPEGKANNNQKGYEPFIDGWGKTEYKYYDHTDDGYRAGGVFVQGGTVVNCYIIDNKLVSTASNDFTSYTIAGHSGYGAGMYLYNGTVYNCVIANNYEKCNWAYGAGVFVDQVVNFFNNTVVNNTADNSSNACGGIAVYTYLSSTKLNIYNSIIANNTGMATGTMGDENVFIQNNATVSLYNCLLDKVTNYTISSTVGQNKIAHFNCQYIPRSSSYSNLFRAYDTTKSFVNWNLRIKNPNEENSLGESVINKGLNNPEIDGEAYDLSQLTDMDYKDRIQDCTIDIGAYEYTQAYNITPDLTTVSGKAIYYVTPEGKGLASGADPENAACASKLQKVLDAAGRYKYLHPAVPVIVKVANSKTLQAAEDAKTGNHFTYYACRTTDDSQTDEDVRIWSIIIPRGVEVWGGYSDQAASGEWSNTNNGFFTKSGSTVTDQRDILANPTYFDSHYYSKDDSNTKEKTQVTTYHVVTFSDKVFDAEGTPYLATDITSDATLAGVSNYDESAGNTNKLLKMPTTAGRAVLDGIFVTGGKADIQTIEVDASKKEVNVNSYGGAAIVTDYAHVRNCILRGNYGKFGGALALSSGALVSGCLVDQNEARYGGGLYVFENGTVLDENTTVNMTSNAGEDLDANMPHVYTSTIVNNTADIQGGGIWFSSDDANVARFNSIVVWQNNCQDQSNVSGMNNPTKASDDNTKAINFYPFAYSAVENIRMSGTSNISVATNNKDGVKFAKYENGTENTDELAAITGSSTDPDFSQFGYYLPTKRSTLLLQGMSTTEYNKLVSGGKNDKGLSAYDFNARERSGTRSRIDMGARAYDKEFADRVLMLRLFVSASSEDGGAYDNDVATAMENLYTGPSDSEAIQYYSQEGSSFAYPFMRLQDAIDYIRKQRSKTGQEYEKLPFEIFISKGTYTPEADIYGKVGGVSNTFLIPEGVSVYGGFDGKTYYGRKYKPATTLGETSLADNISVIDDSKETEIKLGSYTIKQTVTDDLLATRTLKDQNRNGITEPWEMTNQVTLAAGEDQGAGTEVDHIMTLVADASATGKLPFEAATSESGCQTKGQPVLIDGISFKGGNAGSYVDGEVDQYSLENFSRGGAILVDGNRTYDSKENTVVYQSERTEDAIGYRDLPLFIKNCKFTENTAGYGAALATNGTAYLINSTFEDNTAKADTKTAVFTDINDMMSGDLAFTTPGVGGAVYYTGKLYAFNTLFANNEAQNTNYNVTETKHYTTLKESYDLDQKSTAVGTSTMLGGVGGALYGGKNSSAVITNCNVVRNMANAYPAMATLNPNCGTTFHNRIVNSIFWGNELNSKATAAVTSNALYTFAGNLICNFCPNTYTDTYNLGFTDGLVPADKTALDACAETAWFTAYESGRGRTAVNSSDERSADYASDASFTALTQNSNQILATSNTVITGPNFKNPSTSAGNDGYMENAGWQPSRTSSITDNGWGRIGQKQSADGKSYEFDKSSTSGFYSVMCDNAIFGSYLPIADDQYMLSGTSDVYRISLMPRAKLDWVYIDLGMYEYNNSALQYTTVDDVDIMYASVGGQGNGSSWEQATEDIQGCIEKLLHSRNGHRKEIRISTGSYSPKNSGVVQPYTINTLVDDANSALIELDVDNNGVVQYNKGVRSLTIKGGYSTDGVYNLKEYPVVFTFTDRGSADATSTSFDHLISIEDATQRYGIEKSGTSTYTSTNGYGALIGGFTDLNSIPIEIDGITFKNDQVLSGSKGSAIYYADQKFTIIDGKEHISTGVTEAKIQKGTGDDRTYGLLSSPAKLIVKDCVIAGSGCSSNMSVSAVYVGKYGGHALIFNNVFHSNYGFPLEAYNAVTLNNTFALNTGHVLLMNSDKGGENDNYSATTSCMHNSVLWKNHPKNDGTYDVQFSVVGQTVGSKSTDDTKNITYNTYTSTATNKDRSYETGSPAALNMYNVSGLSNDNDDIIYGPNFVDVDNEDILSRNFSFNPSYRLLGRGDDDVYNAQISVSADNTHTLSFASQNSVKVYDYAYENTVNLDKVETEPVQNAGGQDAFGAPRIVSKIDLGAYECQKIMNKVLFVDPYTKPTATYPKGRSWGDAFGPGDMQAAIDLAGVYNANDKNHDQAYVFMMGKSDGSHSSESLTLRDGVEVYGSIDNNSRLECKPESESKDGVYTVYTYSNSDVANYLDDVIGLRAGVASTDAWKTSIGGIKVGKTEFYYAGNNSLMDGFVVTPMSTDDDVATESAVDVSAPILGESVTEPNIALRNLIVYGFNKTSADVIKLDKALIYDALVRDNKTNANALSLGTGAFAVNVTVDGQTDGTVNTNVFNSLVNYDSDAATKNSFTGYNYPVSDLNLNYQLTEQSKNIDACDMTNPIASKSVLSGFIDYTTDRDLLGNPRLLTGVTSANKVDAGAFETWRIDNDVTTSAAVTAKTSTHAYDHRYPHTGSVVYVMASNNLVCNADLVPSYLLVQEGANVYGQGNKINAAYVSVERGSMDSKGAVVSMPFKMAYSAANSNSVALGVGVPSYTDGVLSFNQDHANVYKYNGNETSGRAYWQHKFASEGSACWQATNAEVDACTGVLYVRQDANASASTFRFTAKGTSMTDYIYTESGTSKDVTLACYNDHTSTSNGADFTSKEDMGWNCIGVPYLVSVYRPYKTQSDDIYKMDAPHVMWLYYDGKTDALGNKVAADGSTKVNGDGGFYSVNSWESGTTNWKVSSDADARIWMGEGFFVQNAKWSGDETLTFYLPTVADQTAAKRVNARYLTSGSEQTEEEMIADESASDVKVYVQKHTLYVKNITDGADINVYTSAGQSEISDHTENSEYSVTLSGGVHVVSVNGKNYKVYVK